MKVLVNGGINFSELDGWWAEAYAPGLGWALGDGQEHGDHPAWDRAEAEMLYDALEREVIPEFYARDKQGIPTAWMARIRESMAQLTPQISADRAVREYTEQHYIPAAAAYRARTADQGAFGRKMVDWRRTLEKSWSTVSFGRMNDETHGGPCAFEVKVHLGQLGPADVRVELYADGLPGALPVRQEMKPIAREARAPDGYVYRATVSAGRQFTDYTARVIPRCEGVAISLEDARIVWQR